MKRVFYTLLSLACELAVFAAGCLVPLLLMPTELIHRAGVLWLVVCGLCGFGCMLSIRWLLRKQLSTPCLDCGQPTFLTGTRPLVCRCSKCKRCDETHFSSNV